MRIQSQSESINTEYAYICDNIVNIEYDPMLCKIIWNSCVSFRFCTH